ncbi:MAG: hypothetical protein VX438_18185, partial [Planctomycetota bacterium]|nr:hypothetical protein [Planctomycetota bacterium]
MAGIQGCRTGKQLRREDANDSSIGACLGHFFTQQEDCKPKRDSANIFQPQYGNNRQSLRTGTGIKWSIWLSHNI